MKTSVILGSMLAVAFIIYGGITYMTTDTFSGKTEGKEHLTNAIGGLIFLIGGYLIFTQINPDILNVNFNSAAGRVEVISSSNLVDILDMNAPENDPDGYNNWAENERDRLGESAAEKCADWEFTMSQNTASTIASIAGMVAAAGETYVTAGLGALESGVVYVAAEKAASVVLSNFTGNASKSQLGCEAMLLTLRNLGVQGSNGSKHCHIKNHGVSGAVQEYCFFYDAVAVRENEISKWKKEWEDKDYYIICRNDRNVYSEKQLIHKYMGGHKVSYNQGNGLQIKYFSADGDASGSYNLRFTKMCVAGKPLGDDYEVAKVDNGMNMAFTCKKSGSKSCNNLFEDLEQKDKYKNCGKDDWKTVYDKQEDRYNIAIKSSCITR